MSRVLLFVAGSLSLMSCIIPREPNYQDPPNYPPSVEDSPSAEYPMGRIIKLLEPLVVAGDAGPDARNISLRMVIRDPNIDQTLAWRAWLDDTPDSAGRVFAGTDQIIPDVDNDPFERELEVPITSQLGPGLNDGCHRIDVYVTTAGNFNIATSRPIETDDVGRGTWWIARGASVDMNLCPSDPGVM